MRIEELERIPLDITIELMQKAHAGQTDKAGHPYHHHPMSVLRRLQNPTEDEKHAAVLHDVVEDSDYSLDNLREMGYNENILRMIALLTRDKSSGTYLEWIQALADSGNRGAIKIKIADNEDNMAPERIAQLPPEKQGIAKRYEKSLQILQNAL